MDTEDNSSLEPLDDQERNGAEKEEEMDPVTCFRESKSECMLYPLCYEADDEVLGKRFPGGFVKNVIDSGHICSLSTFDNGDQYLFDTQEKALYYLGKMDQSKLIHKYLEKVIYDCADNNEITFARPFYCANNEIDIPSFLRLLINQPNKVVNITNIFIPVEKRLQNIGKNLIAEIYWVCSRLGFRLVLLDVMESFKERLRLRNALVNDYEDSVEITQETDLKSHFSK